MQTLFLFAIFGMFTSAVLGIVASTTVSTMQVIDKQIADTKQYFRNVAFLITEDTVMKSITVPTFVSASDYLLMDSIVKGANWSWGKNTQDAWGSDIIVKSAHEYYALDASAAGVVVQPKSTAILLVSPGQNKTIDPALQARLDAASPSDINALMGIEATAGTDDIVYTFNTRRALEKRWHMVSAALQKMGKVAQKRYSRKFADADFNKAVQDYYTEAFELDYQGSGIVFDVNKQMKLTNCVNWDNCDVLKIGNKLDNWQDPTGVSASTRDKLTNTAPNMEKFDNETTSSWGKNIALLTDNTNNAGFSLSYRTVKSDAGNVVSDILYLEIDEINNNSAWLNGSNNFHYEVQIGE